MTENRSKLRVSFKLKPYKFPLNNPCNPSIYRNVKPEYPTKRHKAFRVMKTSAQILTRSYVETSICAVDAGLHLASELCLSLGLAKTAALTAYMHDGLGFKEVWATLDSGASLGLISESEALNLNATVLPSPKPYSLSTANSAINASNLASLKFPSLNHAVTLIILENSPFCLSVGELVQDYGYSEKWDSKGYELKDSEGQVKVTRIENNTPQILLFSPRNSSALPASSSNSLPEPPNLIPKRRVDLSGYERDRNLALERKREYEANFRPQRPESESDEENVFVRQPLQPTQIPPGTRPINNPLGTRPTHEVFSIRPTGARMPKTSLPAEENLIDLEAESVEVANESDDGVDDTKLSPLPFPNSLP